MPVKGFRCQSNLTSQIGWKSIEITLYACLVELGGNPLRLHCLLKALDAGQIGWKSIEITLYACLVELVELGGNPLRLHCLLKALDAGQIRPVELGGNPLRLHCMPAWLNWSNWVEIH